MKAIGCDFTTPSLAEGPATAQSLINVTADAQRTMSTYLGACVELNPADVDPAIIEAASSPISKAICSIRPKPAAPSPRPPP
jgi:sugar/nucleoside kinase (ribokinase family)